jgi:hypothetical protein
MSLFSDPDMDRYINRIAACYPDPQDIRSERASSAPKTRGDRLL